MKFAFFLSTYGGSPMQIGLERGLTQLGHQVTYFANGMAKSFDVLVIFNQSAHTPSYAYPDFPAYDTPVVFVDNAEYGYFRRLPGIVGQYANAFAPGSMAHDTKSLHEQTRLQNYLNGKSFPYFLREFSIYLEFPENYHPIDYPLYHYSACGIRHTRDQFLARSLDLFVSWGASHPWRWHITDALRSVDCRSEIKVVGENGTPRMPQGEYFNKMLNARLGVSFDGYGSGSFRMTEVLVRGALLQGPLSIHTHAPLEDEETAIFFDMSTEGEHCQWTNVSERLMWAIDSPSEAFRIYQNGYDHCMANLTEKATAQYLVETIEAHDWGKPTPLSV